MPVIQRLKILPLKKIADGCGSDDVHLKAVLFPDV